MTDVDVIERLTKKMRELGIVSLRLDDIELVLGPEPVAQTLDHAPVETSTSTDPGKLPPRNSPIWWSTPHYVSTPEKKDE